MGAGDPLSRFGINLTALVVLLAAAAPEGREEQFVDDLLLLIEDMNAEGASRCEIARAVLNAAFPDQRSAEAVEAQTNVNDMIVEQEEFELSSPLIAGRRVCESNGTRSCRQEDLHRRTF